MFDEFGAMALMLPALVWTTVAALMGFWTVVSGGGTAMTLAKFANDIIEWTIVLGAWLMWYTMCYWCDIAHRFWKLKVWPLPSLMPGGFMPRLAAFSLGILMFTTSTLVSEGRVKGSDLQDKFGHDHWQECRATDMEADDVSGMWFSRMLRRPPAVSEGYACFGAHFLGDSSIVQVDTFNSTAFIINGTPVLSVQLPYHNKSAMGPSAGFPMDKIEQLNIFDETDFPTYTYHCMYQCVKWKTVGLMSLIKNVGSIVAGSAVVVKTSDTFSTNFGGHIWGLPLITGDTPAKVMSKTIELTSHRPGKGRSKLFAAFACLAAMSPLRFASKLDIDGYYTVDYYVTAVFLCSLFVACLVRQWNPYKLSRIAYTQKMWLNGEDKFIDFSKHTHRTIDLYEWIHLTQESRSDHLMGYARMVTVKAVTKELDSQKHIHELGKPLTTKGWLKDYELTGEAGKDDGNADFAKSKQALENFEESKKELRKAQKETSGDDNARVMSEQYHNGTATLMVRTIKAIAVITCSPPITGPDTEEFKMADGSTCPRGSILYKSVVLKEGAIGTIVDKVDDGHIRVRFPQKQPTKAPVMSTVQKEIQYNMEFSPALQDGDSQKVNNWMRLSDKKLKKRLKKPDDDAETGAEEEEDQRDEDLPECELVSFEDVVVPLEQVIECSAEWLKVLRSKKVWDDFVKKEQAEMMQRPAA